MVRWSPDGKWLASAGWDGKLRVWQGDTMREVATLVDESRRGKQARRCLAWSPDGAHLASGGNSTVLIWEAGSFDLVRRLSVERQRDIVNRVEWSPQGDRLAISTLRGMIEIIGASDGAVLASLVGHSGRVNSIAWSPDGRRLASAGLDHALRLWDTATGFPCLTIQGHDDAINAVAWSPDGNRLASGSTDKTIKLWDSVNRKRSFVKNRGQDASR